MVNWAAFLLILICYFILCSTSLLIPSSFGSLLNYWEWEVEVAKFSYQELNFYSALQVFPSTAWYSSRIQSFVYVPLRIRSEHQRYSPSFHTFHSAFYAFRSCPWVCQRISKCSNYGLLMMIQEKCRQSWPLSTYSSCGWMNHAGLESIWKLWMAHGQPYHPWLWCIPLVPTNYIKIGVPLVDLCTFHSSLTVVALSVLCSLAAC